jgi:hypothetical protein
MIAQTFYFGGGTGTKKNITERKKDEYFKETAETCDL